MLYIVTQKTNLKNYLPIIFTEHYYFPIITHFLKKYIYLYFRAWKIQKGTLWEQKTIHTKFHTDTASFPRIGDHLMKCISQNLWGRVKLQSNIIKSAAVLLFLIGRAVSLDLRSQNTQSEQNLPEQELAKAAQQWRQISIKTVIGKTVHIFRNVLFKHFAYSRKAVSTYFSKQQHF